MPAGIRLSHGVSAKGHRSRGRLCGAAAVFRCDAHSAEHRENQSQHTSLHFSYYSKIQGGALRKCPAFLCGQSTSRARRLTAASPASSLDILEILRHLRAAPRPLVLRLTAHTIETAPCWMQTTNSPSSAGCARAARMPGPGCTTRTVGCVAIRLAAAGPNSVAVADIVQESFLAAAATARQFDPDRGTLWSWLAGIAHHRVSAFWRRKVARRRSWRF